MEFWPFLILKLNLLQLAAGLAFSLLTALISYRYKTISFSGACGMIVIGTIVFGLGGAIFAIPLIFFFVSSSSLSAIKTAGKRNTIVISHKSGPRDIWQVLANGGAGVVAVIIYFVTGNIIWYFAFLASLCEATSDTWATEIGTLLTNSPISIVTLQRVETGQSGGLTILGTFGAIGGTFVTMLIARSAGPLLHDLSLVGDKAWLVAANCGLVGCLLDSVLGGSIQVQYRCSNCHRIVERDNHCGLLASRVRGLKFVGNDLVNFVSCAFAAVMATIILLFGI
jgi:uncharacterized protein (TIGR00297 family)